MTTDQKLTQYEVSGRPDGTIQMVPNPCGAWVRAHEAFEEIERVRTIADGLLNHCDKEGGECSECGRICCPHKDPMHFHHDGCPSCSQEHPNG